jgi:O-succinylbenzoic acid--CoA ligase
VTDDLGELDLGEPGSGRLRVLGRADDVIVTGGVKVVPAAVEAVLRALPEVADVVVLGVADAEWGERVRAVVVAHMGDGHSDAETQTPSLASLRAAVTARLGAAHAPRDLVLVERISRDELGKVSAAERARLAAALPDDAISA